MKLTRFSAIRISLALAFASLLANSALAGLITFTGDTTDGPTYNRPLGGIPPTSLSNLASAVRYDVNQFTLSLDGPYNFRVFSEFDNYLGIHFGSFNPANGLENALAYNDDFVGLDAGFSNLALDAGVTYFAVVSAFTNSGFGPYSLEISGPGDIIGGDAPVPVPVPTPATLALFGLGLAGLGWSRRKKA